MDEGKSFQPLLIVRIISNLVFHVVNCYNLMQSLFQHLTRGTKLWVVMLSRLIVYTVVMMPGWIHLVYYWLFSPFVIRNIEYGLGQKYRNLLDVYLPMSFNNEKATRKFPVIILVSGGAWIIGYKMWSCLVGRSLSILGFLTVVPDYRNFPQGTNEEMMDDIREAVLWTVDNVYRYGGDPDKISLAGQSAGAQICLSLLIREYRSDLLRARAALELEEVKAQESISDAPRGPDCDGSVWRDAFTPVTKCASNVRWGDCQAVDSVLVDNFDTIANDIPVFSLDLPSDAPPAVECAVPVSANQHRSVIAHVKLFMGISGPYNLTFLSTHMHRRGLDVSILNHIFHSDLRKYSPSFMLSDLIEEFTGSEACGSVIDQLIDKIRAASDCNPQSMHDDYRQGNEPRPLGIASQMTKKHKSPLTRQFRHLSGIADANSPPPSFRTVATPGSSNTSTSTSSRDPVDPSAHLFCRFPPVALFHGNEDYSIPSEVCTELSCVLRSGGGIVNTAIFDGWSHTTPILEGPLSGRHDLMFEMKRAVIDTMGGFEDVETSNIGNNVGNHRILKPSTLYKSVSGSPPLSANGLSPSSLPCVVCAADRKLLEDPAVVSDSIVAIASFVNPF